MNEIIGNTPMIKINYQYEGEKRSIYVKLESYNLTGSIKDRVASYIITKAYQNGTLKKGMPIIEATSGNTGISFSALGAFYNHPVIIFMPDWVSKERVKLIESYGATTILVSREEGGFEECIKRADHLASILNGYRPNQFSNKLNIEAHYMNTGVEIIHQMPVLIHSFVSGIGTGGTLIGVGKRLKEENSKIKIIALEPAEAPLLSGGKKIREHAIEGIGDDFIPSIVDQNMIDDIYLISDEDAINMSRLLASRLGLAVGISSGANMLASIKEQQKTNGNVVTVFPDDNKKYLSTKLMESCNFDENLLSNQIELIDYEVIAPKTINML